MDKRIIYFKTADPKELRLNAVFITKARKNKNTKKEMKKFRA